MKSLGHYSSYSRSKTPVDNARVFLVLPYVELQRGGGGGIIYPPCVSDSTSKTWDPCSSEEHTSTAPLTVTPLPQG